MLQEVRRINLFFQLFGPFLGMEFLHMDCNLLHRDLKVENLLLNRDDESLNFVCKVCDFGMARCVTVFSKEKTDQDKPLNDDKDTNENDSKNNDGNNTPSDDLKDATSEDLPPSTKPVLEFRVCIFILHVIHCDMQ